LAVTLKPIEEATMISILDQLNVALEKAEPNILGNRYARLEIDGDSYHAAATTASSHQGTAHWGRIDYKKNGKKIAKAKLA